MENPLCRKEAAYGIDKEVTALTSTSLYLTS